MAQQNLLYILYKLIIVTFNTRPHNSVVNNIRADEKRNIISELLWNLSVKDRKIAQVSYRSPYDILAKAPKNGDIFTLCRG